MHFKLGDLCVFVSELRLMFLCLLFDRILHSLNELIAEQERLLEFFLGRGLALPPLLEPAIKIGDGFFESFLFLEPGRFLFGQRRLRFQSRLDAPIEDSREAFNSLRPGILDGFRLVCCCLHNARLSISRHRDTNTAEDHGDSTSIEPFAQ